MNRNNEQYLKRFNCETNEELYSKIKNKDPEIKEIIDIFEKSQVLDNYAKKQPIAITTPDHFASFISGYEHKNNMLSVFYCDIKLNISYIKDFNLDDYKDIKDLSKDIFTAKYKSKTDKFFFIRDKNYESNVLKHDSIETYLERKFKDKFLVDTYYLVGKSNYISKASGELLSTDKSIKEFNYNHLYNFQIKTKIDNEFSKYYSRKENIGLNLIKDNHLIRKNLQLGYENNEREESGFLLLDRSFNVTNQENVFSGGRSATIVDPEVILNYLLNDEKVSNVVLFHNHPSGNLKESQEDIHTTLTFQKIANELNIKLIDHYIISTKGVKSLLKERYQEFKNHISYGTKHREYINTVDNITSKESKIKGR